MQAFLSLSLLTLLILTISSLTMLKKCVSLFSSFFPDIYDSMSKIYSQFGPLKIYQI